MRLLLALSLLAASVAFVPSAAAIPATCVNGVCAQSGSGAYDNCDGFGTGYQWNYVGAYGYNPNTGSFAAGASTSCYDDSSFAYTSSGIGVGAYSFGGPLGYTYAGASWAGYTYYSTSACNMGAYAGSTMLNNVYSEDLGCPVGNPPDVPAILP